MTVELKNPFLSRCRLVFLALLCALSASAQPATNIAAATGQAGARTNQVGALVQKIGSFNKELGDHDLTFHLDKIEVLRDNTLGGQPLWKYLASLIYIVLAFYISKLLDFVVNAWFKRWAARSETKLDDLILALLHGPVKVITFVVFLHIGLNVFRWPLAVEQYLSKGLIVTVSFSLTYAALKVVDLMMGIWRQRTAAGTDKSFDDQLFPVIRKAIKLAVVVVAVVATWQNLSEKPLTAILASLSIGGLAIGLAAQDTLGNLFGAIAVYIDKPFRIGDRIQLDSVDGEVENIGLRSTQVRSLAGHHVTIPNKTVGNATITNISRRPGIKTEMNFGLTYDTPAPKVRRALALLQEIYGAHPQTGELLISFNKFTDSSLNLIVVHLWTGTENRDYLAGMQELNLQVKERFDAEGIGFAFPSQTLYLKQDSAWRMGTS